MFPKDSSGFLRKAEEIATKNSGREVAKAIKSEATTNSFHPKTSAILVKD